MRKTNVFFLEQVVGGTYGGTRRYEHLSLCFMSAIIQNLRTI